MQRTWDGEAFVKEFMAAWRTAGTPPGGTRFDVDGVDVLTLRDGRTETKRAHRKSTL